MKKSSLKVNSKGNLAGEDKQFSNLRSQEQGGDRSKLTLSPDSLVGGGRAPIPPSSRKKKTGHSHNNSQGVNRPALVLQQP